MIATIAALIVGGCAGVVIEIAFFRKTYTNKTIEIQALLTVAMLIWTYILAIATKWNI